MFFVFKKEDLVKEDGDLENTDVFVNLDLIEHFGACEMAGETEEDESTHFISLSLSSERVRLPFVSKQKRDEYLDKLKTFVVNDDETLSALEKHIENFFGSAKKKVEEVKSNVVSFVGRNKKPAKKKVAAKKKTTKKETPIKPTKRKK